MPWKRYVAALCFLTFSSGAQAALLTNINGTVLVNEGDGFRAAADATEVRPGARVVARDKSSAYIEYAGGCVIPLSANQTIIVPSQPDCHTGSLKDPIELSHTDEPGDRRGLIIGGLLVAGGAIAVITHSGDDDKPASP